MLEEKKKIHINLPADIHKKLRLKCSNDDISMQDYVENLIARDLQRVEIIVKEKTPN